MTVQNLAPFVANLINGQSIPSLSATITDSNGTTHNVIAVPLLTSNSVTYILVDPNVFSPPTIYTAVQVTLSLGGTVIVQESVNVQISYQSNIIVIQVTISDNTGYNFAPIIQTLIIPVLIGVTPANYSVTLQWTYTLITYATTTTSSGTICTSAVAQSTTQTPTGGSASGSGMTLTFSLSVSYGSCQQVQSPELVITVINSSTKIIPLCAGCSSATCGYNASCTTTLQLQVGL